MSNPTRAPEINGAVPKRSAASVAMLTPGSCATKRRTTLSYPGALVEARIGSALYVCETAVGPHKREQNPRIILVPEWVDSAASQAEVAPVRADSSAFFFSLSGLTLAYSLPPTRSCRRARVADRVGAARPN